MGRRKKFKPNIPVVIHHDDGHTECERIDISVAVDNVEELEEQLASHDEQVTPHTDDFGESQENHEDCEPFDDPTLSAYYAKVQRKQKAWEDLRPEMLIRTFQFAGQNTKSACIICGEKDTSFRCMDCSHGTMFCKKCVLKLHTNVNMHHNIEILKDGVYWPFKFPRQLSFQCSCSTSTPRHSRTLTVSNCKGYLCDFVIQFCSCLPEFVQLLQFGLWGGTPSRPRIAFEIELFELIHAIQLECHASLKSICNALESKSLNKIAIRTSSTKLYPVIIDAFEEYRLYRHKLNNLTCILPELDEGNVCPACPKANAAIFYSLDALFIGRRKNAGQSNRNPIFGEVMFHDQGKVDRFIAEYNAPVKQTENCHNFLAGNAVRSKSRYKDLDETAIFGCGCRHEFPKNFTNLKHGERLSYAVWILTELEERAAENPNVKINILYDIACTLTKHLQNQDENSLLNVFQFAIPLFHCYGHNGKCQILFSPRRKQGFGLTDGEMLERLWAYIRGFGKMTKEMRPSHRIDVLTDALLHYGKKTSDKIEVMLVERLKRAMQSEEEADRDIKNLFECFSSQPVDMQSVRLWQNEEVRFFDQELLNEEISWRAKYVVYLDLYNSLYQTWQACQDPNQLTVKYNQMKKIDEILLKIEEENTIACRWTTDDDLYQAAKRAVVKSKREKQLLKIRKGVVERCFLLGLKSKYSDGQSIATRLAKQINRITKTIRTDIEKFNKEDDGFSLGDAVPLTISFDDAKDPDSPFWLILSSFDTPASNEEDHSVPSNIKRKAIDLCHLLDRAREEKALLKDEMRNTFRHYLQQHDLISDFIVATSNDQIADETQLGELLFCRKKLLQIECRLIKIEKAFSGYIDIALPHMFINTDYDTDEPSDHSNDGDEVLEEDGEEDIIVNPLGEEFDSQSDFDSDDEFSIDNIFL